MKKLILSALLIAASPALSFADHHTGQACTCSKECQLRCQKGDGKDCKCQACDCAKSGKCGGDHCKHHS